LSAYYHVRYPFSMPVETIGEARHSALRMGSRDAIKRRRESVYCGELDMLTLVWTRAGTSRSACWKVGCDARVAALEG
jgi:hypothetical protein